MTTPLLADLHKVLAIQTATNREWAILGMFAAALIALGYAKWRTGVKAALVLVLFEGVVRRWAMPSLQEINYLWKDMLLAGAYLRFFLSPGKGCEDNRGHLGLGTRKFMLCCCCIVSFSAINTNLGSIWLALLGIKLYIFYLPLVVMMPYLFTSLDDLNRNLMLFALLALPICCLGIQQWWTPSDSFLSVYAQSAEPWVAHARVTSTFSYRSGYAVFVMLFFALHLGLLRTELLIWGRAILLVNLPLLCVNALLVESTQVIASLVCITVLYFGFLMMVSKVKHMKVLGALIIMITAGSCLTATLFPDEETRFYNTTVAANGPIRYYKSDFGSLMSAMRNGSSVIGYGIAVTHPVMQRTRRWLNAPEPQVHPPIYDNEMSQVYVELGVVGFLAWYSMRLMFALVAFGSFKSGSSEDTRGLHLVFALVQVICLFFPFVFNGAAGLLVSAVAGISL